MQVSLSGKVIFNAYDLSEYLNKVGSEAERELKDRNTFAGQGARQYKKGLLSYKADAEGFYNFSEEARENIDSIFQTAVSSDDDNKLSYSLGALAIGGVAVMINLTNAKFNIADIAAGSLLMSTLSGVSNKQTSVPPCLFGAWMMSQDVTVATNGTTVDKAAAATGYFARFIVLESDGVVDFVLQHSTNGTTWVDLDSSDDQAAETVIDKSSTVATINRYVRVKATPAGTTAKVVAILVHGYEG